MEPVSSTTSASSLWIGIGMLLIPIRIQSVLPLHDGMHSLIVKMLEIHEKSILAPSYQSGNYGVMGELNNLGLEYGAQYFGAF